MRKIILISACLLLCLSYLSKAQVRVVCVGNSITEGYGLPNSTTEGYPARLSALLGPGYSVLNCGVSGKTMLKSVDASYWTTGRLEVAKNFEPDIVIIKLGTNDSDPVRWTPHKGEFYADYVSMINEFRLDGRDPIIFVAHCAPLFANATQDANIKNEVIPILEQITMDEHTLSIDFYNTLLEDGDLFPDGVHPGIEGAKKMANIAFEAIQSATSITSYISINDADAQEINQIDVDVDDKVVFEPSPADGTWSWQGPNDFISDERLVQIDNIQLKQGGVYKMIHTSVAGTKSVQSILVSINGCTPDPIVPYMRIGGTWQSVTEGSVAAGGAISMGPQPSNGIWSWTGPNDFVQYSREYDLNNIRNKQTGVYQASYYNPEGCMSTLDFTITVTGDDPCLKPIVPYLKVNNGDWKSETTAILDAGGAVYFGPQPLLDQTWLWTGPNGFTASTREITLANIQVENAGVYTASFTDIENCITTMDFTITLNPIVPEVMAIINGKKTVINIYPNPTADEIVIEGVSSLTPIKVFDLLGEQHIVRKNAIGKESIKLDTSGLIKGIYFLKIGQVNDSIRFVKQ